MEGVTCDTSQPLDKSSAQDGPEEPERSTTEYAPKGEGAAASKWFVAEGEEGGARMRADFGTTANIPR
jgi:hypothetical protein